MRRLLAFVLVPLTVALAGCAGAAPSPSAEERSENGEVKPKVDRIVMALRRLTTEGATPRMVCCFDAYQHRPSHENLLASDPKTGALTPGLASEWKWDPVTSTVVFKLREGVRFHGDTWGEMTADDFVFSFESLVTVTDPPSHVWSQSWFKRYISKVEAKSPTELVMHIQPQAQFWLFMSDVFNMLPARSRKQHEAEGEPKSIDAPAVAGTGPYQWAARRAGEFLRYQRVPYKHWRVTPDFPELEFRFMNEPSTRMAALLAGEVHMTDLPPDLQPQAERAGMKTLANQSPSPRVMGTFRCCYFDPQTGRWPMFPESQLLDIRVREALNRAINREELGRAFAPKRQPLYVNHFSPLRPGWDPSWERRFQEKYGYDPNRARQLLADAGYGPAKPLEITMVPAPLTYIANGPDITEAVAGYFRAVGVKVNLVSMDAATETAQYRAYRIVDHVRMQSIGTNLLDGIIIWNGNGNPPGSGYYNPELIALVNDLNKEMDPEKQEPLLRRIGEWGFNNYWDIPLWFVPTEITVNPQIVADYQFSGSSHGGWSHFETIKASR